MFNREVSALPLLTIIIITYSGVAMKQYQAADIRNIALAGHGGSGKTAFVEAALQATGVIDRMGRSDQGNTVLDFDAEEIRRGMTINLSYAAIEWQDKKLNLLDTPGDFDFLGEQIQGFKVSDSVLVVMSAKDGLAVGVEKAVRQATKQGRPISFLSIVLTSPTLVLIRLSRLCRKPMVAK